MRLTILRRTLLAISLALTALNAAAHAQDYPTKTVTIVVSIAAGTGMDVVARLYADKLQTALGKPVVVENRPGAATWWRRTRCDRTADGYTLVVLTSGALAINPALYKQINYDPNNDFVRFRTT